MENQKKRLIIIGAGFAGINLAKNLHHEDLEIVLVDRHNYHLFQPLLYQVATAALSPADIAHPVRRIFRKQKNVNVALGRIERVDLEQKKIYGGDTSVDYDYLALCVGATHSYFGKEEKWAPVAPGLKTLDDATLIRRKVLLAFEEAELELDEQSRRAKLTFVVVGGGPTGVELAGALREIAAKYIQEDFRNIDTSTSRVILLEGGDRLLQGFSEKSSQRAKQDLEKMGVEVRLNSLVTDMDEHGVWIAEERLLAQNVLWAAGVAAPPILSTLGVETDKCGRIKVEPDLSVPGHPEVFVLGDAAHIVDPKTHELVPGLAPAAIQMGKYGAKVLRAELSGDKDARAKVKPFVYTDKGIMATIGVNRAVAETGPFKFSGTLAWLAWSLIHIFFLIGFRNRVFVMAGWIYDYIARTREARLITGQFSLKVRKFRKAPKQA